MSVASGPYGAWGELVLASLALRVAGWELRRGFEEGVGDSQRTEVGPLENNSLVLKGNTSTQINSSCCLEN